jgi:hypothetical protein
MSAADAALTIGAVVIGAKFLSTSQMSLQPNVSSSNTPGTQLPTSFDPSIGLNFQTVALTDASQGRAYYDLFITDVSYTVDESALGKVMTGTQAAPVASTTISMRTGETYSTFDPLQSDSIVRFVSSVANTVTDYMMVRSLVKDGATVSFVVDAPVLLDYANQFTCQLVRKWIPVSLPLTVPFKLITACEVKAFAFTGISSGNLYEGTTGVPQHDFIGLSIAEIPGRVRSTNPYMERMLAVLPTHMPAYHPSSWNDARDAMIYLPDGIAKTEYGSSPIGTVGTITPRLVDRRGNDVRAARFHLWLRITAQAV